MIKNSVLVFLDKIRGIKYGPKITKDIGLNRYTTKQEIESIISSLDHRMVLYFYDAYYGLLPGEKPVTKGDTGAFAYVIKNKDQVKLKMANHGWASKKWNSISSAELVNKIYKSREFNNGNLQINSRLVRTIWIKEKDGKSLVRLYHLITD